MRKQRLAGSLTLLRVAVVFGDQIYLNNEQQCGNTDKFISRHLNQGRVFTALLSFLLPLTSSCCTLLLDSVSQVGWARSESHEHCHTDGDIGTGSRPAVLLHLILSQTFWHVWVWILGFSLHLVLLHIFTSCSRFICILSFSYLIHWFLKNTDEKSNYPAGLQH